MILFCFFAFTKMDSNRLRQRRKDQDKYGDDLDKLGAALFWGSILSLGLGTMYAYGKRDKDRADKEHQQNLDMRQREMETYARALNLKEAVMGPMSRRGNQTKRRSRRSQSRRRIKKRTRNSTRQYH